MPSVERPEWSCLRAARDVPVSRRIAYVLVCGRCAIAVSDRVTHAESVAQQLAQTVPAATPDPAQGLVAGNQTQLRLRLDDSGSLERYFGAWGHMLVASADLIDMMYEHPYWADGGAELEFHEFFPRPQIYRARAQLRRRMAW
jgi:hypothetical protein